jgi:hypothetical protein
MEEFHAYMELFRDSKELIVTLLVAIEFLARIYTTIR